MNPKIYLVRFASLCERAFDAIRPERIYGDIEIDPYFGYTTPTEIILRGRVLSRRLDDVAKDTLEKPVDKSDTDPSLWENFKSMIALFNTQEIPNVPIRYGDIETLSDEEGYFKLSLPRANDTARWSSFDVSFGDKNEQTELTALTPSPEAEFGIISDIDDTLIKTDAWNLRRNLWNSLTGNAQSRLVYPDAVRLISKLHAAHNPIFYVSSSPWNMHGFLTEIFDRAGLVRGPIFLRDLGISDTQFITGTHGQHKGEAIDEILNANPDLSFTLLGDTGQHDPHVYHDAILRHPGRIKQVILRAPKPKVKSANQGWIDKIIATETPIYVGETYASIVDELT